jgi:pimeloyl-ACP methyl ester carboxylesterase
MCPVPPILAYSVAARARRWRAPASQLSAYEREDQEIEAANASGNPPVVFIHGLWLLPSSWDRWVQLFSDAGYAPLLAG